MRDGGFREIFGIPRQIFSCGQLIGRTEIKRSFSDRYHDRRRWNIRRRRSRLKRVINSIGGGIRCVVDCRSVRGSSVYNRAVVINIECETFEVDIRLGIDCRYCVDHDLEFFQIVPRGNRYRDLIALEIASRNGAGKIPVDAVDAVAYFEKSVWSKTGAVGRSFCG